MCSQISDLAWKVQRQMDKGQTLVTVWDNVRSYWLPSQYKTTVWWRPIVTCMVLPFDCFLIMNRSNNACPCTSWVFYQLVKFSLKFLCAKGEHVWQLAVKTGTYSTSQQLLTYSKQHMVKRWSCITPVNKLDFLKKYNFKFWTQKIFLPS